MRMPSLADGPAGALDYALLIGLAVIWGSSFMLQELVLPELPPAAIASVRLVSCALALGIVALVSGPSLRLDARGWGLVAICALVGSAMPFFLIAWGQGGIDAGPAAILLGLMPLLTLVIGHWATDDERITWPRLAGVSVGLVGLLVLVGPASVNSLGGGSGGELVRQGAVLLAALCYAANVFVTRALSGAPRYSMVAAVSILSAIFLTVPTVLLVDVAALSPSVSTLLICVMLGVVHTGLATLMMFALVRRRGGNFFGLVNLLVPITGVAWAFAVLGERPGWNAWIALLLIVGGVALSRRAPAVRPVPAPAPPTSARTIEPA